jgi:TfoX/Sxy family transcriptional regulator of competence genes
MAWVKIPAEHHPLFTAAVPDDGRVETLRMFGGVAALVNGHMFGGLWADSAVVRVDEPDQREALALGGTPFDPMGKGRVMKDMVVLPRATFADAEALRGWLTRALAYTATLPPKPKKAPKPRKAPDPRNEAAPPEKKAAPKKAAAKKTKKKAPAKKK